MNANDQHDWFDYDGGQQPPSPVMMIPRMILAAAVTAYLAVGLCYLLVNSGR